MDTGRLASVHLEKRSSVTRWRPRRSRKDALLRGASLMQSGIAALETAGRFLSAKGGTRAKRTERDKSGLPCEGFLASYDSPIRDSRRFRVLQKLQDLDQIVTRRTPPIPVNPNSTKIQISFCQQIFDCNSLYSNNFIDDGKLLLGKALLYVSKN